MSVRDCLMDIKHNTYGHEKGFRKMCSESGLPFLRSSLGSSQTKLRDCIDQFCATPLLPNSDQSAQFTSDDVNNPKLHLEQWRHLMANFLDIVIGSQVNLPRAADEVSFRKIHDHMHGRDPLNFEHPETLLRECPRTQQVLTPFTDYLSINRPSGGIECCVLRLYLLSESVQIIHLYYRLKVWDHASQNVSALLKWRESALQRFLDAPLKGVGGYKATKSIRSKIQEIKCNLCVKLANSRGIVPSKFYITGITQEEDHPFGRGGFAEVWSGHYKNPKVQIGHPKALALKIPTHKLLYKNGGQDSDILKALCREAVLWKRAKHQNVLRFIGICKLDFKNSENPRIALVSPRMKNGNLLSYIKRCVGVSRSSLLAQIAHGLIYLHSVDIIHGDLKCANVLVNDKGVAQLADFGLSSVGNISESMSGSLSESAGTGNPRWLAPELMIPADPNASRIRSFETDVYALGMTALEMFTEQKPFSEFPNDAAVIVNVFQRDFRPQRPGGGVDNRGLTDDIWSFMEKCWRRDPFSRPKTRGQNFSDLLDFSVLPGMELLPECYIPHLGIDHWHEASPLVEGQGRNIVPSKKGWFKHAFTLTLKTPKSEHLLWGCPKTYTCFIACRYLEYHAGSSVTCRVLKGASTQAPNLDAVYHQNYSSELRESNVAPLIGHFKIPLPLRLGLIFDIDPQATLVLDYISETSMVKRLEILISISNGLSYLHRCNVVHGDLRSANIVVEKGIVRLVDYGIPTSYKDETECVERKVFLAPEILRLPSDVEETPTKESDIYSIAMTFYEILTERIPFSDAKLSEEELLDDITGKELRPKYPGIIAEERGLSTSLWTLMSDCWNADASARPIADRVLEDVTYLFRTEEQPASKRRRLNPPPK